MRLFLEHGYDATTVSDASTRCSSPRRAGRQHRPRLPACHRPGPDRHRAGAGHGGDRGRRLVPVVGARTGKRHGGCGRRRDLRHQLPAGRPHRAGRGGPRHDLVAPRRPARKTRHPDAQGELGGGAEQRPSTASLYRPWSRGATSPRRYSAAIGSASPPPWTSSRSSVQWRPTSASWRRTTDMGRAMVEEVVPPIRTRRLLLADAILYGTAPRTARRICLRTVRQLRQISVQAR
jgi:hypothetical protein